MTISFRKLSLLAFVWAGLYISTAAAVEVTVNPNGYTGPYRYVDGTNTIYGYFTGSNTSDVPAGDYRMYFADQSNGFHFNVSETGNITSTSTRIDIVGSSIVFRTAPIMIDPGPYTSQIRLMGRYHATSQGITEYHLVPAGTGSDDYGSRYVLGLGDQPTGMYFDFDENGQIWTDSTRFLVSGNTITLSTVPVHVEAGLFPIPYRFQGGVYRIGSRTIHLMPEGTGSDDFGNRYILTMADQSNGMYFYIDTQGNLTGDSSRFILSGSTITFTTIPVTFNPNGYTGQYNIGGVIFIGTQTLELAPLGIGADDVSANGQYYTLYDYELQAGTRFELGETCEESIPSITVTGAQGSRTYNIECPSVAPIFSCDGFYSPLAQGPVKVKKNRALPVKSTLLDGDAALSDLDINTPPVIQVLYSAQTQSEAIDVTDEAYAAGMGNDGNTFTYNESDGVWQHNLKTSNFTSPGTYSILMKSGDEDEYIVDSCLTTFVVK